MENTSIVDQHLVWGWNNNNQLGHIANYEECLKTPTPLPKSKTFITKSIANGLSHSLVISNKFKVYVAGKGQNGRLGRGDELNSRIYEAIPMHMFPAQIKIIKVSCGGQHSAFISDKRDLYTFGKGDSGQLGHGDYVDEYQPKKVDTLGFIDLIACGTDHTIVSTNDGSVYCMGSNKHRQLGFDTDEKVNIPTLNTHINPAPSFLELRYSNINAISCGQYFTVLIKNGLMYSFGINNEGQCGFAKKFDNIIPFPRQIVVYPEDGKKKLNDFIFTQVSCGIEHAIALTNDGVLFGFGSSKYGQLAQGLSNIIEIDTSTPIRIGESLYNEFVTQISCGSYHCLALTESGSIYSWGLNDFGQCGNGSASSSNLNIPYRIRLPVAQANSDAPIAMVSAGGRSSMAIRYAPSVIVIRKSNYIVDIMSMFTKCNNNIQTYSDCQITYKDSKNEVKTIKAHRLILSRSSVFNSYGALDQGDSCTINIESLDLSKFFSDNQREIYPLLLSMYNDNIYDTTNTIANHLFNYVNNERFSDLRIRVEFEGEIKIFCVHKSVLISRSSKFKTLLESQFSEAVNSEIVIDSSSPEVYYTFLHYLYTDRLNINGDNVIELYILSHKELQERMKELLESYLYASIDDENVSSIYEVSNSLNVDTPSPLEEQCVYYIAKNFKTVSQQESFKNLSPELHQKLSLHSSSNTSKSSSNQDSRKNCILQ